VSARGNTEQAARDTKSRAADPLEAADVARLIVDIASEKQASDIVMLDLRQVSLLADYFVICSAASERQMTAIVDEIRDVLRNQHHLRPLREEGKPRGRRGIPLPRSVHAVDRYRDGTGLTYDAARARIQGFGAVPAQGE